MQEILQYKIGTTTQTGPDALINFDKINAIETLKDLWQTTPVWVPKNVNRFKYPLLTKKDYLKLSGEFFTLPESVHHLLDLQNEQGYLSYDDIQPYFSFFKNNKISVAGSLLNSKKNDKYLIDPINGKLVQLPSSNKGIEIYHKFYTSRFDYIKSIPNAFKFLGREKINTLNNESALEALSRTVIFVCGLGTGGGETSIRLGKQFFGINLALIDGGIFGPENTDRQVVTPSSIGLNKSVAVASRIFDINPMIANIFCLPHYINKDNADDIFDYVLNELKHIKNPIIQIVDEIDVTEEETLIAKAELHHSAIKLANRLQMPIYVHWSLDIGASGEVVGTCRYIGNETKIFQGKYSTKLSKLPAILAMFDMVPKKAVGLEMIEDIKKRLAKNGKIEHISQTGLSAIGVAKILCTRIMLTSLGYGSKLVKRSFTDDLRKSFKPYHRLKAALKRIPLTIFLNIYGRYNKQKALRKSN
jgi:hypothetical protein